MIVSADIASILARDARSLGISEVYNTGSLPAGAVTTERICVAAGTLKTETYWSMAEASVNLYVPDANGVAAPERLRELERAARTALGTPFEVYDNTPYRYAIASSCIEADAERACHFINIKINFKVLNIKN